MLFKNQDSLMGIEMRSRIQGPGQENQAAYSKNPFRLLSIEPLFDQIFIVFCLQQTCKPPVYEQPQALSDCGCF